MDRLIDLIHRKPRNKSRATARTPTQQVNEEAHLTTTGNEQPPPPVRPINAGLSSSQPAPPTGFEPSSQAVSSFTPTRSIPIPLPRRRHGTSRHPNPPTTQPQSPFNYDLLFLDNDNNNDNNKTNPEFSKWWSTFPPPQLIPVQKPGGAQLPTTVNNNNPDAPTLSDGNPQTPQPQNPTPFCPAALERQVEIYSADTKKFNSQLDLLREDLAAVEESITALKEKLRETEREMRENKSAPLPKFRSHPKFSGTVRREKMREVRMRGKRLEGVVMEVVRKIKGLEGVRGGIEEEIEGVVGGMLGGRGKGEGNGGVDGDEKGLAWKVYLRGVDGFEEEEEEEEGNGLLRGEKLPEKKKRGRLWEGEEMGGFMGDLERLRKRVEVDGWLVRETGGAGRRNRVLEGLERTVEAKGRVKGKEREV
ncbi:hypothetical protein QBC40DRAFT_312302 [Triangularia verruculosa]|uniref:Uncharacterized protein n=1 Tax=Triangularia verruculosa TaxID=2587418 RepID=A0AAN6XNQ1_9PEZI|nr:hypothetical protein QBC40DRAFT_312302 [Triangularia verruculosa]